MIDSPNPPTKFHRKKVLLKSLKSILFFVSAVLAIVLSWRFVNNYLFKSRATADTATIAITPTTITKDINEQFTVGVTVTVPATKKISAFSFNLMFARYGSDTGQLQFMGLDQTYFNDVVQAIPDGSLSTGADNHRFILVAKKPSTQLASTVTLTFRFKGTGLTHSYIHLLSPFEVSGDTDGFKYVVDDNLPYRTDVVIGPPPTATVPAGSPTVPAATATSIPSCACTSNACSSVCNDASNTSISGFKCVTADNCSNTFRRSKGDASGDNKVCLDDWALLQNRLYSRPSPSPTGSAYQVNKLRPDFNGDGEVGATDIDTFRTNYQSADCGTSF